MNLESSIFKIIIDSNGLEKGILPESQVGIFVDIFAQNFIDIFAAGINSVTATDKEKAALKTYFSLLKGKIDSSLAIANFKPELVSLNLLHRLGDLKSNKSVVQIDMDGNEILSNEYASFSSNKENAKKMLGSIEKINDNELLVADSINKRAFIIDVISKKVIWEYISDRCIFDVHLIPYDINISVTDEIRTLSDITVNINEQVTWVNDGLEDITIYFADVSQSDFDEYFDINKYANDVKSQVLKPTEKYTMTFGKTGFFNWFSYPNQNIGKVIVQNSKFSSLDKFIIVEGDGNDSQFTNRVVKIDSFGKTIFTWGEGYLVKPNDVRPLVGNKFIIST